MRPINDFVIISPDKIERAGSIFVPDNFQEDSGIGQVLYSSDKCTVQPGDRVMWDRLYGAGFRFDHEGREILALHESDIFATL